MTFRSHVKAPSRAFDHLYDPIHKSTCNGMQKMNLKALCKTAPLHIIPCHYSMFSDLVTKRRNFYFPQRNPLPLNPNPCSPKTLCDRAISTTHFIYHPVTQHVEAFKEKTLHLKPQKSTRSVKCQTMYRESSAQTDPWLPEAKLLEGDKGFPEVLLVESSVEPGLREVEAIERARIRRQWEKALPSVSSKDLPLRIAQLEALEWENIIARERQLNEEQMDRMQQVSELMEQRQELNKMIGDAKLKNVQERCQLETNQQKSKLEIKKQRKLKGLAKYNGLGDHDDYNSPKLLDSTAVSLSVRVKVLDKTTRLLSFKPLANSHKSLSMPKDYTKRCLKPENKLKLLYQSLKSRSLEKKKNAGLRCRSRREIESPDDDCEQDEFNERADELFQNQVVVQKTIKGSVIMKSLQNGVDGSCSEIRQHQRKFQLDCIQEVLPDLFADTLKIESKSSFAPELDLYDEWNMESLVDEILGEAVVTVVEKNNVKLLQQAAEERAKRQEETYRKLLEQERWNEMQRSIDEAHEQLVDETLKFVLPSVIELIATKDSRTFIEEVARVVDNEACSSTSDDETTTVDSILENILAPEVVKRVESAPDKNFIALLAANDAIECHLKTLNLNEIHMICQQLINDVLRTATNK